MFEQVCKELIQRMIGVANDQDSLSSLIMYGLGKEGTYERLACPYSDCEILVREKGAVVYLGAPGSMIYVVEVLRPETLPEPRRDGWIWEGLASGQRQPKNRM